MGLRFLPFQCRGFVCANFPKVVRSLDSPLLPTPKTCVASAWGRSVRRIVEAYVRTYSSGTPICVRGQSIWPPFAQMDGFDL
jgi:hypothetical protein